MLALLCAAAAIAYAQRQVIAVAKESIQADLDLSKTEVGWIMSAFFAGYAICQIPVGWAGDTFGAVRVLAACVAFSALATALLPVTNTIETMLIVWTICGMAQAGLFPIAARLVVATLPATRRATASGFLGGSMSVGAAVMAAAGGELLGRNVRWQVVVLAAAAPGLVWALVFAALYGRHPVTLRSGGGGGAGANGQLGSLLRKPSLWLICLQQFLRAAGYVFFVSWFSTYLQETGAISVDEAGWLNGLPLLAVVVGSPLGGIASDFVLARTGSRRLGQQLLAIVSLLACAGCVAAALLLASPLAATMLISLGAFAAAMCGSISYAVTMQAGGERVATAFGIMNMCGSFGATLFPIVAAELRTATGDWELVLAVFAGIYLAAAICWMFIDPD
ncbi:MAG TPA: MFS transporter [Pirellulales bacterium]